MVLLEGPFDIAFAYRAQRSGARAWADGWSGAEAMPEQVRLTIADTGTDRLRIPVLVQSLQVDAEVDCASPAAGLRRGGREGDRPMRERGDRGIVLVAVLLMVAIMSVMVVAITALTRSGIASQGLEQRRLATHLALRSGLESAKALILATPAEQRVYFDGTPVTIDLGGGVEAEVTIRDAQGLVDLNRTRHEAGRCHAHGKPRKAEAETISGRIAEWRKKAEEKMKKDATAQPASSRRPSRRPTSRPERADGEKPPPRAHHLPRRLTSWWRWPDAADARRSSAAASPCSARRAS